MKLHELIKASEPKFKQENFSFPIVDRASYDRMKQIAVALAKYADDRIETVRAVDGPYVVSELKPLYELQAKCRELLGEK